MTTSLRKWYFAINENGLLRSMEMIGAAVKSCRLNTDLVPHCIYVGRKVDELAALRDLGVSVVSRQPSLRPELEIGYGRKYHTFSGHWLRLEVPEIEREDDFVLYTDIDVIFRSMPAVLTAPRYIAVAPEHQKSDWSYFNSGVMLMNLPALRGIMPEFKETIRSRLTTDFTYPTHDQASFNAFFAGRFDRLPLEMNWKPYWGENRAANIVHFHGPKPRLVSHFEANAEFKGNSGIRTIWRRDRNAYRRYSQMYFDYAAAEVPAQRPTRPGTVIQVDSAGPLARAARMAGRLTNDGLHGAKRALIRQLSSLRSKLRPGPRH